MDSLLGSSKSNKVLKEEFVSNLTGSSLIEIAAHSAIVPALILLRHLLDFNNIQDHVYASTASMKKDDDAISSSSSRRKEVLSEWAEICGVSLMILLLLFILVKRFSSGSFDSGHESIHYIRKVISSYRVSMMIVTCLCILAVDFKIYPRRYAKTETYGTGLDQIVSVVWAFWTVQNAFYFSQEVAAINTGWPSALAAASWIAASKFYCGYEVLGSLSYWSLLGKQLILWKKFWPKDKQQSLDKLLTVIFDKCIERVSRRMCNLSYITFILAQNFQVLAILTLIDFIPGKRRSVLEEAFNQNLLGIFLLANILTGLVNMQFDTIAASSTTALAILFSYSFILCIAAGFTAYSGIKMKFW
ncbi:hypothetical protein Scep_025445 [Stephania cephalantha]|uniref:Uncharacterized protein n=1 Tax=Stephania cephalantha TaxID=152367 RepID=A0AAP0HRK5_9MAGN